MTVLSGFFRAEILKDKKYLDLTCVRFLIFLFFKTLVVDNRNQLCFVVI